MALKVVPAGDERCDVHNRREPQKYICETCLGEFGIEPVSPAATRRARARRALRSWRSGIDRKVLVGVGAAVLIAGVILVIVVVAGGGGGQKDGVAATPEDLVACLKGDGIQDAVLSQPAPDAAGGTAAVAVVSRERDPLYGNIIEITYFGNPAEAEAYLDPSLLPTVSAQRERLADTVTADYSASYGSAGPPELESIKSCLSQ
jgi:hypothetical protein